VQDRRVQLLEVGGGLDAELADELSPGPLVAPQRLGGPAGPVQREHQLRGEPLVLRVLLDERGQLVEQSGMTPQAQQHVGALLGRCQPGLVQVPAQPDPDVIGGDPGQRRAVPQPERLVQQPQPLPQVAAAAGPTGELPEPVCVHPGRVVAPQFIPRGPTQRRHLATGAVRVHNGP
jgi:hypothetical protein